MDCVGTFCSGFSVGLLYVGARDFGMKFIIGPSDDDQAVSLSDDGTTIIIDFFSSSSSFLFSLLPPSLKSQKGLS